MAGATVMVNGALSKNPAVLVARTTMPENVPAVVGLEALNTPAALSVKPPGSGPDPGARA